MNMFKKNRKDIRNESGNVLFLILIAVALFAALSYAVTQSTRSGGGGAASETNLVNSAQITQYPAGMRTALVRMVIKGIGIEDLTFNPPSDFGTLGTDNKKKRNAFHPQGGGGTFMYAPTTLREQGTGEWFFNANYEITNIGVSGDNGNEWIAFLPGITAVLCSRLNEEYGLGSGITTWDPTNGEYDVSVIEGGAGNAAWPPGTPTNALDTFPTALDGEPYGCFQDTSDNRYVYYHVLMEQ